ncbi:hypothetical protein [Nocardia sp. NPDC004711]
MAQNRFRAAFAPTAIAELVAVPIHILGVEAAVRFDCARSVAVAEATMHYVVGPHSGNPAFDLRQRVDHWRLDGMPIAADLVRSYPLGGDSYSTMRVLGVAQAAGSVHSLGARYHLDAPAAEPGGVRPAELTWLPDTALRWIFGMSDLNAGRYLEA